MSSSSSSSSLAAQGQGLGLDGGSGFGYRGYGDWLGRENGGSTRASSSGNAGSSSGGVSLRTDSSMAAAGPYTSMLLDQHLAQQEKDRQMQEHHQQQRVMERSAALTNRTAPPDGNKLPVEGLAQRAFRLAQLDNPATITNKYTTATDNMNRNSSSSVGQSTPGKTLDQKSKEKSNNNNVSIVNPAVSASLHDRQDYLEKMKKMRNNMLK